MLFNFRLEHFEGWSSTFEISIINSSMLSSIDYFIFYIWDYYILKVIISGIHIHLVMVNFPFFLCVNMISYILYKKKRVYF